MYHSGNNGVGYYRVWQPAKHLTKFFDVKRLKDEDCKKNIPYENVYSPDYDKEIGTYKQHAEWADLLVFQNVEKPELIALIKAIREVMKKVVAIEVDDNLMAVPLYNPVINKLAKNDGVYWGIIALKECDFVTTTTPYLANVLSKINKNVEVIPNYVDFRDYGDVMIERDNTDIVTIGFVGSPTHYNDLLLVMPAVRYVLKNFDNVIFKCFGAVYDFVKELKILYPDRVKIYSWIDIKDYFKTIAKEGIDIWLAPLVDNEFNRSKSNIKYLEAGATKSVCVASDIEPYKCIKDGMTGYKAVSKDDFKDILIMLVKDKSLIKKIGENAYCDVYENWNIETRIEERAKIYKRYLQ